MQEEKSSMSDVRDIQINIIYSLAIRFRGGASALRFSIHAVYKFISHHVK